MRTSLLIIGLLVASASAAPAQRLQSYAGRWVPKELVDSAGREILDTTVQVRRPLQPITERLSPQDRRQYQILVGMAQPSRSIDFNPAGDTLIVTYNDEITFRLPVGGPPLQDSLGGEIRLRIRARWADRNLHVEFEPEGGGKYIETYALADSGIFLRVDARLDWGKIRGQAGWSEMYRKVAPFQP